MLEYTFAKVLPERVELAGKYVAVRFDTEFLKCSGLYSRIDELPPSYNIVDAFVIQPGKSHQRASI